MSTVPADDHRCRWCGRTYNEHHDVRPDGPPVATMLCMDLKSHFRAREPGDEHKDAIARLAEALAATGCGRRLAGSYL